MKGTLPNPDGDVALCGTIADAVLRAEDLDPARLCSASRAGCRADLEQLLRDLSRQPSARHVVLCGDDPRRVGEALLSLLRDGLDDDGRLHGARGTLSRDLDPKAIDAVRTRVRVWDWREKTASEVARAMRDLDRSPGPSEVEALVDPEIPRRKVFLSRKTSFPLFSADAGDGWLQLLNLLLKIGVEKTTATGERFAQTLNTVVTVGLPVIAEDLEVETPPERKAHADYLDFTPDDFEHYFRRVTTAPPSAPDRAGDRFGARLHELCGLERFESVCRELAEAAVGGTSTVAFHAPDPAPDPRSAPGLLSATFETTDGALFGSFVFRSVDVYSDWPLEAMALMRFQREAAERLGLGVGASTFLLQEAHLLALDWSRAERLLDENFRRPLPLQVDHSGVFLFGNDGGKARGMLLDHDAGTIFWEEAFENAQQLSWYIVDAMPWLLPQHVRYVGQECSTLTRAMEEKACYLQG